ncbi:secondary carrier transporter [Lithospermum erythrorhizon]|uniref:Mitochondrial proton/calcium exchanger protein n=1 Tax=Lithospermum erythrorhizon TaxID=34254 RepID=A0AAV3QBA9_LITER
MASRAILHRRKCLLDSINKSTCLVRGFSSFKDRGLSSDSCWRASCSSVDSNDGDPCDLTHDKSVKILLKLFPSTNSIAHVSRGSLRGPSYTYDVREGTVTQFIRFSSSTAPAKKPEFRGDDAKNQLSFVKQKKEASPEECDQAVEGLSTIIAKAKAKQLQEAQKDGRPSLKKVWATLLGIGPAVRAIASMSREDWAKKLRHWKVEFKTTLQHYWLGTKLLWADARISSRLLLKLAAGKPLSRRERQQLKRTTADIFRLVPFGVFVIVPFMEFLLPVFLKVFPNMLPSTFQDKMKEQEKLKKRLNARLEYARFLQETVKEMAKEIQDTRSGETKKTAEDLDEFMDNVRRGTAISNDEILVFAKLFNDELTLDNISRPRLVNMCKYMSISPYGTDAYLRYMLQKRLRKITADDKMIQDEGLESLSEDELRQACRERGMLGLLSADEMRVQLLNWLDLSLNHSVPSSLLLLSRAFSVSGKKPEEIVQATLSSLPDELVDTIQVTSLPSEDTLAERRRRLEYLEMQEELIKEEQKKQEEQQAKLKESHTKQKDVALEGMMDPTAREREEQEKEMSQEKQEQFCVISRALSILALASSVSREREDFLRLVNKEIGIYNSMVEKEGVESEAEAKKAYKAAREESNPTEETTVEDKVSSFLIDRVDDMLQKLEKEIDDVDATIGNRWRLLDRDYDGKVTAEEVASAASYLKDTLDKEGIQELISNLSKDREGKIRVEDIVRLASQKDDKETTEEEKS